MTQAATAPTLARWQTGWEIPVNVTTATITLPDGGTQTVYEYDRVIVASLSAPDLVNAVDRDHGGDPSVLGQARETADGGDPVAAPAAAVNRALIRTQALTALAANRAYIASTPTAAQATAQTKALSRQVNGIIRLLLNELDATD